MLKLHNHNISRSILHRLNNISTDLGIDLWIKRDDLLPLWGGGNKARKMSAIIRQAEQKGYNSIVTCGGLNSNHARAAAMAAASTGWKCRLILHTNSTEIRICGNLLLCQLANAQIDIVKPQDIASAMKSALKELLHEGLNPLEIPGGGHLPIGGQTYIEALFELQEDCEAYRWYPDIIVLPSGTGTTQAGILAGIKLANWETRVIGISVARTNPRGASSVIEALEWLRELYPSIDRPNVEFRDEWICEGYEHFDSRVIDAIQYAIRTDGLILDPTYTGKAFAALLDMVKNNEIPKGAKVLFWHTGGQFNLMTADVNHNNQIQTVSNLFIADQKYEQIGVSKND